MEKFNFNYYNDSIKRIKCYYTYDDNVYTWEGYIRTSNVDGLLNIEGYETDIMDSKERSGKTHHRCILGTKAISYAGTLIFEIYPTNIAPIQYEMYYDETDKCFYGTYHFEITDNHPHHPNCDKGDAIIYIEDVTSENENEITRDINSALKMATKAYYEEIAFFKSLSLQRLPLTDPKTITAGKKLSRYVATIKQA